MGMAKISTLLLFDRIFPFQKFHRILQVVDLFILVYSTISAIMIIFHCGPLRGAWDPTIKPDCVDLSKFTVFMGSMNVFTDFPPVVASAAATVETSDAPRDQDTNDWSL